MTTEITEDQAGQISSDVALSNLDDCKSGVAINVEIFRYIK